MVNKKKNESEGESKTTKGKSAKKVKRVGPFAGDTRVDNANFAKNLALHNDYLAKKKRLEIKRFREKCESLGFSFIPSEEKLVDLYVRSKNSGKDIGYYCPIEEDIDYCPIEEAEVYGTHPKCLIDDLHTPGKVWYFFTRSRPNEIQSSSNVQGRWIFAGKGDVFSQGNKIGVKQVFEFWEGDHRTSYTIIEYQLDPAPVDPKAWFVCKLLDDMSCLVVPNEA